MFQYYKDLKEHDDSISSFFKCEPKENKKVLDYKFLRIWVEKCAIRKSENKKLQRLESRNVDSLLEPLKEKEFIKLFSENSEITTEEIQTFENRNPKEAWSKNGNLTCCCQGGRHWAH